MYLLIIISEKKGTGGLGHVIVLERMDREGFYEKVAFDSGSEWLRSSG